MDAACPQLLAVKPNFLNPQRERVHTGWSPAADTAGGGQWVTFPDEDGHTE